MATVDGEGRKVLFQIAVIGAVGQRFVELLGLTGGELELAEVQGYRPRFAFRTFPDDPWADDGKAGQALEELVPYLDALVLTDDAGEGTHYSSSAVERLAKLLSPVKLRIPAAVFGGPALADEWQSLSGAPIKKVSDPREGDAQSVFKELARVLLRSGMRSTPPPPPVG